MKTSNTTSPERASTHDIKQQRAERKLTIPALVFLSISVAASYSHQAGDPITTQAVIWSVAFLLSFAFFVGAVVHTYKSADELQKLIHLRAASVSFAVTISGLFIAGLLHSFNIGKPSAMIHALFVVGALTWFAATTLLAWRAAK